MKAPEIEATLRKAQELPSAEALQRSFDAKQDAAIALTYQELIELKESSSLQCGRWYRITDYAATTTIDYTRASGHQFDILVMAADEDTLCEDAYGISSVESAYMAKGWNLKYCVENDTRRFTWVDPVNGKGVIYWMRDEFGNEAPFDFKSIQFQRWKVSDSQLRTNIDGEYVGIIGALSDGGQSIPNTSDFIWCYLFSMMNNSGSTEDISTVYYMCHNNKMCTQHNTGEERGIVLPNNVFILNPNGTSLSDNIVTGDYFKNNTFKGKNIERNTFSGNNINQNTIAGDSIYANVFSASSYEQNTFANNLDSVVFSGNRFRYNSSRAKMQACIFPYPVASCTFNVYTAGQTFKCVQTVGQLSSQSIMVTGNSAAAIFVGVNSGGELKVWKPADQVYN